MKSRPSPVESATSLPEGSIRRGGDGNDWVVKKSSNGTPRWSPIESVELNGWKLLTTNYLAKHIGKPITYYRRQYSLDNPNNVISKFITFCNRFQNTLISKSNTIF